MYVCVCVSVCVCVHNNMLLTNSSLTLRRLSRSTDDAINRGRFVSHVFTNDDTSPILLGKVMPYPYPQTLNHTPKP